jgi:hypothetical protein
MHLTSFGCSFIFGTDLHDDGRNGPHVTPSNHTWPALCAQRLGLDYSCRARGGSGNLQILDQVLREISNPAPALFVIGWTWIERFDYEEVGTGRPPNEWQTVCPVSTSEASRQYYRHLHSEFRDKLTTLIYIKTAIDSLEQQGIPFVMTYMDDLMLDRTWHAPASVQMLQDYVRPYLHAFEDKTFLDYSRAHNFEISAILHPLETAHAAASRVIFPVIKQAFDTQSTVGHLHLS